MQIASEVLTGTIFINLIFYGYKVTDFHFVCVCFASYVIIVISLLNQNIFKCFNFKVV